MWAVHVLSVEGRMQGPVEWATDRGRFLGRGRGPEDPGALDGRAPPGHAGGAGPPPPAAGAVAQPVSASAVGVPDAGFGCSPRTNW